MAHDGLARVISPVHTAYDGDIVFALSTAAQPRVNPTIVGSVAADLLAQAVVRAVRHATGLAGVPSIKELVLE
jgi:L-aminopeptidase/D-esterase-like protein